MSMRENCIQDMVRFHSSGYLSQAIGEVIDNGYRCTGGHDGERFTFWIWREPDDKNRLSRQPVEGGGITLEDRDEDV